MTEKAQAIQAVLDDHHNAARWRYEFPTDALGRTYVYARCDSATLAEIAIRDAQDALRAAGVYCRKSPGRLRLAVDISAAQIREALA